MQRRSFHICFFFCQQLKAEKRGGFKRGGRLKLTYRVVRRQAERSARSIIIRAFAEDSDAAAKGWGWGGGANGEAAARLSGDDIQTDVTRGMRFRWAGRCEVIVITGRSRRSGASNQLRGWRGLGAGLMSLTDNTCTGRVRLAAGKEGKKRGGNKQEV